MHKLTKYIHADVSTAHISPRDSEKLKVDALTQGSPVLLVTETDAGFWINTCLCAHKGGMDEAAENYSEALIKLIWLAYEEGCQYIHLDADGPEYPDLPTFSWK